ncbi:MAG TPA: transglycosylase SLT domain-containing protein, partial [Thermodesulfobacteriota bacterium]|nr:transglycosylase SLT domain-containing protein [Thermodesulfobacteriota bacterium]
KSLTTRTTLLLLISLLLFTGCGGLHSGGVSPRDTRIPDPELAVSGPGTLPESVPSAKASEVPLPCLSSLVNYFSCCGLDGEEPLFMADARDWAPPMERIAPVWTENPAPEAAPPVDSTPVLSVGIDATGKAYRKLSNTPAEEIRRKVALKREARRAEKEPEPQPLFHFDFAGQHEPGFLAQPGPFGEEPLFFLRVRGPASPGDASRSKILAAASPLLNDQVKSFIGFFQNKADGFFTNSLGRAQAYEPMMKKILREKNLPEELFYLALIESGFNPHAISKAKACGIWQFMGNTAKRFGLKVDKWVDERRDPEKSTYAAAEYLKNLYNIFNCWFLAAAGYNAGEGKILRAMAKAKSQDFLEVSSQRQIRKETKEYVPMMLAAITIAQDPPKYGFMTASTAAPFAYDTVPVPPATRFDKIARAAECEISEIRFLNPSLIRDKTPPGKASFEVRVPLGKKDVFEKNFLRLPPDPPEVGKHRVRRGETLASIAKTYQVSLAELCEVNKVSPKSRVKPGAALRIPQ